MNFFQLNVEKLFELTKVKLTRENDISARVLRRTMKRLLIIETEADWMWEAEVSNSSLPYTSVRDLLVLNAYSQPTCWSR